jgi:hypothetical protein
MAGRPLRQARARLNWGLTNRCIGPDEVFRLCRIIAQRSARTNPGPDPVLDLAEFLGRHMSWVRARAEAKSDLDFVQDKWLSDVQLQLAEVFTGSRRDETHTVAEWKARTQILFTAPPGKGGLAGQRFGPAPDPLNDQEREDETKGLREPGFYPERLPKGQTPFEFEDPESGDILSLQGNMSGTGPQGPLSEGSQREAGTAQEPGERVYAQLDQDKRFEAVWRFLLVEADDLTRLSLALSLASVIEALTRQSERAVRSLTARAEDRQKAAARTNDRALKNEWLAEASTYRADAARLIEHANDLTALVSDSEKLLLSANPAAAPGVQGYDPHVLGDALHGYGVSATQVAAAMERMRLYLSRRGFISSAEPRSNPQRRTSRARSRRSRRSSRASRSNSSRSRSPR